MARSALLSEYERLLNQLEVVFRKYESGMTPAQPIPIGAKGFITRLPAQDVHHAILLKLAAMLNFLHGALALCEAGIVLGQGALVRMSDEASEDVIFLSIGAVNGLTQRHDEFLDYFWREDIKDYDDVLNSLQSRPQVPREKIAAAIHALSPDPSTGGKAAKSLAKSYSGFVHAAAPHVMEIYDERSNTFSVSGAPDYKRPQYEDVLWNYMFRGGTAMAFAAKAFGSSTIADQLHNIMDDFQRRTNRGVAVKKEAR